MAFWTEQDVFAYIRQYDLPVCSVYGEITREFLPDGQIKYGCTGCDRTGCMFCGFGFHNDKDMTRFQRLAITHPKQYEYCMNGGQWSDNPYYEPAAPKIEPTGWVNWNPKKIWVPSSQGLGMRYVFDFVNQIYGKNFYRYE